MGCLLRGRGRLQWGRGPRPARAPGRGWGRGARRSPASGPPNGQNRTLLDALRADFAASGLDLPVY
ncbi:hypothetical protein KV205_32495, partial [Streptomyces sp. SKN60]|uniref:hypothetical protein n=1 Tax=Streptomyces sp. SKN60 TaxID=2855506 RepID=UPI002245B402